MRTLILLIVLLLAGVVDGSNSCFNDRCQSGYTKIEFEGCGLTDEDIPDLVKCFEEVGRHNIHELRLGVNQLTTIPADLFQGLVVLELLDLSYNNLTTLPEGLLNDLENLQHLDLTCNKLSALPPGIVDGLGKLTYLSFCYNNLTTLPEGLFNDLENLQRLNLGVNKLAALPPRTFDGLGKLIGLYLYNNDLTTLPEGLFNDLGDLQQLLLMENDDLQCFPDTLSDVEVDIDVGLLGSCECTPAEAVMCDEGHDCAPGESGYTCGSNPCFDDRCQSGYANIELEGCGFTDEDIPDLVKCFEEVGRHNIHDLNLERNDLTTIPADLFQGLVVLEELNLGDNKLAALPPGTFDGLGKLKYLYLWANDLTTLPEGLFNDLGELQHVVLTTNDDLQCFPDTDAVIIYDGVTPESCECTPAEAVMCDEGHDCAPGESGYTCGVGPNACFDDRCQSGYTNIELEDCGLTDEDIPDLVKCFEEVGWHNIHLLRLSDNQLTTLPEGLFSDLEYLQELYLSGNNLSTLPPGIFDSLGKLTHLNLGGNDLTTLPEGLFNDLEHVSILDLYDNGLSTLQLGLFDGLRRLTKLNLEINDLTTLPEGLFNENGIMDEVILVINPDLQCVPNTFGSVEHDNITSVQCECTPAEAVLCNEGFECAPGEFGYTCELAMHKLGGELHLSDVRSADIV